jgi:hypothetical protein
MRLSYEESPVQAPVILMSQNRQGVKDRLDAAHDYGVNLKRSLRFKSTTMPGWISSLELNIYVEALRIAFLFGCDLCVIREQTPHTELCVSGNP